MLVYTPDEIFDLLGSVSCETDLLEIEHYVMENCFRYSTFDVKLFLWSVSILERVFI